MPIMGVTRFERLFRVAAGLNVDKNDLKRYNEFLDRKVYDLFVVAKAAAKANGRDVIEPQDLPITKGIQECTREFRKLDEELEVVPLLEQLLAWPPLDIAISERTEARLPEVVGGLSIALGRAFTVVHPHSKNPGSAEWDQVFGLFDLLL